MQWNTISARYSSDRGLIFRIYNKLKKLNTKRINNTISKWANELNRHFSNEEVQIVNKGMKNFSTNLAINEMQIKTTLRFYLPSQKTIIKKTNNSKCCQGCRSGRTVEGRNSYCWWEYKLVQSLWEQVWGFLKRIKRRPPIWSSHTTSACVPKRIKVGLL
jgi:hypothetical protein